MANQIDLIGRLYSRIVGKHYSEVSSLKANSFTNIELTKFLYLNALPYYDVMYESLVISVNTSVTINGVGSSSVTELNAKFNSCVVNAIGTITIIETNVITNSCTISGVGTSSVIETNIFTNSCSINALGYGSFDSVNTLYNSISTINTLGSCSVDYTNLSMSSSSVNAVGNISVVELIITNSVFNINAISTISCVNNTITTLIESYNANTSISVLETLTTYNLAIQNDLENRNYNCFEEKLYSNVLNFKRVQYLKTQMFNYDTLKDNTYHQVEFDEVVYMLFNSSNISAIGSLNVSYVNSAYSSQTLNAIGTISVIETNYCYNSTIISAIATSTITENVFEYSDCSINGVGVINADSTNTLHSTVTNIIATETLTINVLCNAYSDCSISGIGQTMSSETVYSYGDCIISANCTITVIDDEITLISFDGYAYGTLDVEIENNIYRYAIQNDLINRDYSCFDNKTYSEIIVLKRSQFVNVELYSYENLNELTYHNIEFNELSNVVKITLTLNATSTMQVIETCIAQTTNTINALSNITLSETLILNDSFNANAVSVMTLNSINNVLLIVETVSNSYINCEYLKCISLNCVIENTSNAIIYSINHSKRKKQKHIKAILVKSYKIEVFI